MSQLIFTKDEAEVFYSQEPVVCLKDSYIAFCILARRNLFQCVERQKKGVRWNLGVIEFNTAGPEWKIDVAPKTKHTTGREHIGFLCFFFPQTLYNNLTSTRRTTAKLKKFPTRASAKFQAIHKKIKALRDVNARYEVNSITTLGKYAKLASISLEKYKELGSENEEDDEEQEEDDKEQVMSVVEQCLLVTDIEINDCNQYE
ncbi:hypothetical protein BCV71DRAFT_269887 [Rhizopus microsporus]|uniref:Uncharacterized protein n=1 Tax=Rhizopus microsporus TaxID=58291 RepID=A0A1X0RZI2_RHIZD|nr:hypothetical protein BCV71DRAFT_269887 [Rhizopus microsporus]